MRTERRRDGLGARRQAGGGQSRTPPALSLPPSSVGPRRGVVSIFCHDCWSKCADQGTGDRGMGSVDVLRNKAEEYLEKARAISDRQRARLLLVQAHNYLKCAEETEAQQLSARR